MAGTMNLSRDFRELFECLSSREVRYLVVGGYAVAFHGHPRYTKDIDVLQAILRQVELTAEAFAERVSGCRRYR